MNNDNNSYNKNLSNGNQNNQQKTDKSNALFIENADEVTPQSDNVLITKQPLNEQEPSHNTSKKTIANGEALKLAVVGHTNTGKTSILRTLLRDVYFGEVKNEAATTRHVERAQLTDSQTGEVLVALYDTPGLEDASGLMDWLEDNTASRRDGIERLQQFLASDIAQSDDNITSGSTATSYDSQNYNYSQEAKVIRQLLASDMAIYVVDAREPVLGK